MISSIWASKLLLFCQSTYFANNFIFWFLVYAIMIFYKNDQGAWLALLDLTTLQKLGLNRVKKLFSHMFCSCMQSSAAILRRWVIAHIRLWRLLFHIHRKRMPFGWRFWGIPKSNYLHWNDFASVFSLIICFLISPFWDADIHTCCIAKVFLFYAPSFYVFGVLRFGMLRNHSDFI